MKVKLKEVRKMTNEAYERAEEIQKKLKDLDRLHYIACKPP